MCGIAGFIGEDRERIERITAALVHRGPDGNAVYVGSGISLGHARLRILDPRPEGDQPMWNADQSVVMVYNGEIYNYRRLKEEENFECKTTTDTEVLLKLYEKHGIGFVRKLIGMFAFALYDTRTKTLFLARDTGGIKPLYIAREGGNLLFASEMRGLMKGLKQKPEIDFASLSAYLTLQYVPGPRTLCNGIESLPPGTILKFQNGTETRESFAPQVISPTIGSKQKEMLTLPSLMQSVVDDHLISDRPIGIFLSGGMDSSVVLHHMTKATREPVKTFTVRFEATAEEDATRFNRDADLALLTAKHYKTDHEELLLTAEDFRDAYAATSRALDLPNADSVSVAQYLLAKKAKKKVDVVLSGAGGDEIFGGYPRYRIVRILQTLKIIPTSLRKLSGALLAHPSDVLAMNPGPDLALRLLGRPNNENQSIAHEWFDPSVAERIMREHFERVKHLDPVRQMMEVDRSLWLVDESLKLTDAVTMASGLECRVPFLDPRLTAWSLASPTSWHVEYNRTKAFLKDTYSSILPQHLFSLTKASFYPPMAKWIRRESRPLVEAMLAHPRINEFFDAKALGTLFERHLAREAYHLHPLQSLIQLSSWFSEVYDA